MKICIAGKNNIAVDICEYIRKQYNDIPLCVIPNSTDNGENRFQRSFLKYANDNNIKVVSLDDVYNQPDLIFISLEFDKIIKPEKFITKKLFNIHFSLLPKYKGMYTSAIPILNNEIISGVTFHCIDRGIDTGDIIAQQAFPIDKEDTCKNLYLKYIKYGTELVRATLQSVIDDTYIAVPQSVQKSTYYSKKVIDYSNLTIDLNNTALNIKNQIRAFSFRDYQIPSVGGQAIIKAILTHDKSDKKPGTVLEETNDYIRCATIDYDVILFKDHFPQIMECVKQGDINGLKGINHIEYYKQEQEKTHGWTPLMVAAYNADYAITSYLVEHGFDVHATNFNGTSVIMYAKDGALMHSDRRCFDFLLSKEANPFKKDYSGKNLFDYITEKEKKELFS